MKKIISIILVIVYIFTFLLCLESLGEPRNIGCLFVLPLFFLILFHIVLIFKKSVTLDFRKVVMVLDFLYGISPLLLFDFSFFNSAISIAFMLPLIGSVLSFVFIVLENKKEQTNNNE